VKFIFKLHNNNYSGKDILFLDRDGVVIKDTGYPCGIKNLEIQKSLIEKLILFKNKNKLNICGFITNQSGVSRNYFTEEKFWETHFYIVDYCIKVGLEINFTCVNFFKEENYYRKPNNGMLETALKHFDALRLESFMVGDRESDRLTAELSKINYKDVKTF